MTSQVRLGFKSAQGWRFYTSGAFLGLEPAVAGATIGVKRLATDSIGTFSLTLTNLVVGSAVQVETQAGATIENRTAASTSETFSVPTYAVGSAANDLRIKVRKGSAAPFYLPYETLATALVGSQSIFVSQIPDQ
jgi:hypothetical protein